MRSFLGRDILSLKDFERGVALTRACQKALADAEQKVKVLLSREGEAALQAFEAGSPDDNDKDE